MAAFRSRGTRSLPQSSFPGRRRGIEHALLHTFPGRIVVIGVAIKLLVFLVGGVLGHVPAFLGVIDNLAALGVAAVVVYLVFRLVVLAKRRLLWRVRRKLILSYIFIGFVPALLIVAFFLLSGLLLFYNFSSYLLQSRLRAMSEQARFLADSTALEIQRAGTRDVAGIISRKQANAEAQYPGLSIAVVPVNRDCGGTPARQQENPSLPPATAGPWAHVTPPSSVPGWIACSGFAGLFAYSDDANEAPSAAPTGEPSLIGSGPQQESNAHAHLLVRGTAFPDSRRPGFAVVIDLPLIVEVRQRLRSETGIEVRSISAVRIRGDAQPLAGRPGTDNDEPSRAGSPNGLPSPSLLEYHDWASGNTGTLFVSSQLSIGDLYNRISAAQGGSGLSFGRSLLLLLLFIGALFFIIEVVALVMGLALAKSITGSVHALFAGTERVRQGDFTHKIAVKSEDQLGELAGSFNSMTASIEELLRQAAEKKRLEEELRIAHEIQMSLLPQGPLEMPGLSVTALCVPAREVGGDYYDFLPLDDHRVGVLIADVSGKGTSAALYMAELKGLVLSLSQIHTSPRQLLISANRIIAEHLDARSFITMTYAVIDLRAHTMIYARAGHTPLIYLPGPGIDSRRVRILAPDGLVLGLKIDKGEMFERLLEEETLPLRSGDLYLFFTDGITEAMNKDDDCFGENRLGRLIEAHADLTSNELRERVLREIQAFVGDAPQHDDMTMIVLKVDEIGALVLAATAAEPAGVAK